MDARNKTVVEHLWRHQSGASAAEFVLVLPILTILLFGAVDVSGLAWAKMQVGAAARAGASYALTYGFNEAGINTAVTNATGLTVTAGTPVESFGCPDAETGIIEVVDEVTPCTDSDELPGNYVTVGASASYTPIFGWPGLPNSVPLTAESKVRIS